jgi:hypothetical protein
VSFQSCHHGEEEVDEMERGEKGEEYQQKRRGWRGEVRVRAVQQRAMLSKLSHTTPPTQLLRYSYLEQTTRNSN